MRACIQDEPAPHQTLRHPQEMQKLQMPRPAELWQVKARELCEQGTHNGPMTGQDGVSVVWHSGLETSAG